jgi:hypothetical protein
MSRKVVEIPVEVWEFSLQDAEHIAALHRETLRLMNENARLKAELRKRALDSLSDIGQLGEQSAEIAQLKAEVERLNAFTTRTIVPNEELQAQVERLTKAGDEVVSRIQVCTEDLWCSIHRWNAAKEGKQP